MRFAIACALLVLFAMACGDDAAAPGLVDLTIVNESSEGVSVLIDGAESQLDAGDEDTISLEDRDQYEIVIRGLDTGRMFFSDMLSPGEIGDMGGRIVVSNDSAG